MLSSTLKVRLILEHKGFVLMLKQTSQNGGKYTLIGGRMEHRELPQQALIREAREEAGLSLREEDLELVHTLFKQKGDELRIVLYFKATKWEGEITAKEREKFTRVSWLPMSNLPRQTSPTVRHVLEHFKNSSTYSTYKV